MARLSISLFFCLFLNSVYGKEQLEFSTIGNNSSAQLVCLKVLSNALNHLDINIIKSDLMPSARSLSLSNHGVTDGEIARISGLELKYSNLFPLSVSCYSHEVYFYVRANKAFKVSGWDSIPKGYILGYKRGTYHIELAAKKYKFAIYPVTKLEQVIGLLNVGRIDITVGPKRIKILELANNVISQKHIKMLQPAIANYNFFSYLHNKNQHLIPLLNPILVRMQTSGEIELIKRKHMNSN